MSPTRLIAVHALPRLTILFRDQQLKAQLARCGILAAYAAIGWSGLLSFAYLVGDTLQRL